MPLSRKYALLLFVSLNILATLRTYARFHFEHLSINEGLSQSSVYAICEDRQGFMWFGTGDGLNRYDGYRFKIFKSSADPKGIKGRIFRSAIFQDRSGNLWFNTDRTLNRYDLVRNEFSIIDHFSNEPEGFLQNLQAFHEDERGRIWLYNPYTRRLYIVHPVTGEKTSILLGPEREIRWNKGAGFAKMDSRNRVWAASSNGVYRCDPATRRSVLLLEDKDVRAIIEDPQGQVWLLSSHELFRYDERSAGFVLVPIPLSIPGMEYHVMVCDRFRRMWIGTANHGLLCYELGSGSVKQVMHDKSDDHSLSFNIVKSLYIDRSDILWVATDGGGVNKLDLKPEKFRRYPANIKSVQSLASNFIKCFYVDDRNRIWFSALNEGLCIYDPLTGNLKNYRHRESDTRSVPSDIIGGIFKDSKGKLWLGTSVGLCIFDEEKETFRPVPFKTPYPMNKNTNLVFHISETSDGEILVATGLGLYAFRADGKGGYAPRFIKEVGAQFVTHVMEDSKGMLWVGTLGNGLYCLRSRGDSLAVIQRMLDKQSVRSFYEDVKNGYMWIATEDGLLRYHPAAKKTRLYGEEDGMPNAYVYGILADDQRRLWLSTNKGLSCFDPSAETFKNYTVSDGLQSNEFNTGAFYKSHTGELYFGGINGFNWFFPGKIELNKHLPRVVLTNFLVRDHELASDTGISHRCSFTLDYEDNTFTFEYAGLEFSNPAVNAYRYRLEGIDQDWVEAGDKRFARYTDIKPGRYLFRVMAANNDGVWNEEPMTVELIVRPPFWFTWWFILLEVVGFAAVVVAITFFISRERYKRRIRDLEQRQALDQERERISKDMHDDLGSGLTQIVLMSEMMHARREMPEPGTLAEIAGSARKLIRNMGEIIWATNPQFDSLDNLLSYLREFSSNYFESIGMGLDIRFDESVPAIQLSHKQRRNLYLVAKEALHNAVKHSGSERVVFEASYRMGILTFIVKDEGKGFAQGHVSGNGLANMKCRMEEIGGDFLLSHEQGTTVLFSLALA